MKTELSQQLGSCQLINLPGVLKKWLMLRKKHLAKQVEGEFVSIIMNRLKTTAGQFYKRFDATFFKYCLHKLHIYDMDEYFPPKPKSQPTIYMQEPKNKIVAPKSIAMLPDLLSPCCSNYFLKGAPFCSEESMQTLPLLVEDYQELTDQKMGVMICALATEGKGIIMIVYKHRNITPIAGLQKLKSWQCEKIYKIILNGLKSIKQNNQIKIKIQELPLFSPHEIGQIQLFEEFVIRVVVYIDTCSVKKIFRLESPNAFNSRKLDHFYKVSRDNSGQVIVGRMVQHQIYNKILQKNRKQDCFIRSHRCLFFQNQQFQIQIKIENFPAMEIPWPQKNCKLIKPIINMKTQLKQLSLPASTKLSEKKVLTNNCSDDPFNLKKFSLYEKPKQNVFNAKINKKVFEDIIF